MKKALVITYYWPPSGGAGVQRWLKFVKYLPSFGIQPVIITVDEASASYPLKDQTLCSEVPENTTVIKTRTVEFYPLYKLLSRKKEIPHSGFANEGNPGLFHKISRFLRGNLFIPDPRIGWNRYALKKAEELMATGKIDCIITSSPPHSTQLIGWALKRKYNVPWIADLRDPWTDIYYYQKFYHLPLARNIDRKYERKVLEAADAAIVVSNHLKDLFLQKSEKLDSRKFHIIPNGFDLEDFDRRAAPPSDSFIITYAGTLSEDYNIQSFISAIRKLVEMDPGIRLVIRFAGKISEKWLKEIARNGIADRIQFLGYVPHLESIAYLLNSHALLMAIPQISNNEGILTGKLFEYMASKKPIICIGPPRGDAAAIIEECSAGSVFDYEDENGLSRYLNKLVQTWKLNQPMKMTGDSYLKYERKVLTGKLAELINNLY